jgi:hypothetical protein
MAAHNVAGVTGRKAFFATDLFAVGDTPKCLFAWCCTPCAMADARTHMDGSDFCFNLLCMNPVATRYASVRIPWYSYNGKYICVN